MATIAFLFHLSHLFKKNVIAYKTFFQAFFIFYSFNVDCNFSCLFVVNRVSHSMWIAISVAYLWSTMSHIQCGLQFQLLICGQPCLTWLLGLTQH